MLATVGSTQLIVYSYSYTTTALGSLGMLDPSRTYAAQWLNPRDGSTQPAAPARPFHPSTNGTWPMPAKPDLLDWVLYISAL